MHNYMEWVMSHALAIGSALLAAVVAALVIGLGAATWLYFRERAALREEARLRAAVDRVPSPRLQPGMTS